MLPTTALITDIGNDFLYGATPDRLLDWIERSLDHLAGANANVIVTQLPIDSIKALSERRFTLFRRVLFPRSRLTLAAAIDLAHEMNERLAIAGAARKISVIPVSRAWYGFDPIHLKRRVERVAWPAMLASWRDADVPFVLAKTSPWMAAYLAALAPLTRSQFGFARRTAQPSGRFFDGTTISLY